MTILLPCVILWNPAWGGSGVREEVGVRSWGRSDHVLCSQMRCAGRRRRWATSCVSATTCASTARTRRGTSSIGSPGEYPPPPLRGPNPPGNYLSGHGGLPLQLAVQVSTPPPPNPPGNLRGPNPPGNYLSGHGGLPLQLAVQVSTPPPSTGAQPPGKLLVRTRKVTSSIGSPGKHPTTLQGTTPWRN